MNMEKVYFSKNKKKLVFAVKVEGDVKNVSFANFGGSFATSDEKLQAEIEKSFYFKKGIVYTGAKKSVKNAGKKGGKGESGGEEYPEVRDINGAAEVLSAKKIDVSKIGSVEDLLAVAAESGISFPNLEVE